MNEAQRIALAYAPRSCRDALAALWDYDATLGRVVATTTEPMIGQMRLTWWHERMIGLNAGEIVAEPVITALHDVVRDHDVTGAMLSGLIEGWEALLEPMPFASTILRDYATKRGDRLFELSATILGVDVSTGLGAGWALIDFPRYCTDPTTIEQALKLFESVDIKGPKPLRILARIARIKAMQPVDQIMEPVDRWTMLRAVLS